MVAPTPSPKITSWGGNELTPRYLEYIASDAWKIRRFQYWKTHKKRCAACLSEKSINLHHITYEHLGEEPDKDFTPLCEMCHTVVHLAHKNSREARRGRTLMSITARYVQEKRQSILGVKKRVLKVPRLKSPKEAVSKNDLALRRMQDQLRQQRRGVLPEIHHETDYLEWLLTQKRKRITNLIVGRTSGEPPLK